MHISPNTNTSTDERLEFSFLNITTLFSSLLTYRSPSRISTHSFSHGDDRMRDEKANMTAHERDGATEQKCHSYRSALAISAMVWVNGSHFESIILAKNIHNRFFSLAWFSLYKLFKGSHEQMYFLIEDMTLLSHSYQK